eukprot:CAMPEP_0174986258 /NCGR_PEP_ID=MMETSP0004_2-20121128/18827_1 /TAXON_ID=420556 /ORGANISM="Ochromonas sp., Strain CCMP1393" /LENGTH=126 /DNA_ID=CAMNT_0016239057 /DNA_START=1 /DNA_END=378 /DNA_ORIENTATION=+
MLDVLELHRPANYAYARASRSVSNPILPYTQGYHQHNRAGNSHSAGRKMGSNKSVTGVGQGQLLSGRSAYQQGRGISSASVDSGSSGSARVSTGSDSSSGHSDHILSRASRGADGRTSGGGIPGSG